MRTDQAEELAGMLTGAWPSQPDTKTVYRAVIAGFEYTPMKTVVTDSVRDDERRPTVKALLGRYYEARRASSTEPEAPKIPCEVCERDGGWISEGGTLQAPREACAPYTKTQNWPWEAMCWSHGREQTARSWEGRVPVIVQRMADGRKAPAPNPEIEQFLRKMLKERFA